jgi:hypothetical protein
MGDFKYSKKFYSLLPIRNTRTAFSRLTGRSALKYSVRQKVLIERSTKKTFNLKSTALGVQGPHGMGTY